MENVQDFSEPSFDDQPDLTPELDEPEPEVQLAELDSLENPDGKHVDIDNPTGMDAELQELIAAAIIRNPDFLSFAYHQHLNPSWFMLKAHQIAVRVAKGYYKDFVECPSQSMLKADFYKEVEKTTNPAIQKEALDKLYQRPLEHESIAQLQARAIQFIRNALFKEGNDKAMDAIKKGGCALDVQREYTKRSELVAFQMAQDPIQDWDEIVQESEQQKEDWWWQGWSEFASLTILTGAPFSGKSTLLSSLVSAMAHGEKLADNTVAFTPMFFFDPENKARILVKRIRQALGDAHGDVQKLVKRIRTDHIPKPLTCDYIEKIIDLAKSRGIERGVIVLDTLRSLFRGGDFDEIDNAKCATLCGDLKEVATKTGWAILLLHHNNKSGKTSGGTALEGMADYHWNWESNKKSLRATLSLQARDEPCKPLVFQYDLVKGCNVYIGTEHETSADEEDAKTISQLRKVFLHLGDKESEALPFSKLESATGLSRKMLDRIMVTAINSDPCFVLRAGQGNKTSPYFFWLTSAGMKEKLIATVA